MHAKTQMNSEDTKQSDGSLSRKDRRFLAHLKGETFAVQRISAAGEVWD